MVTHGIVLLHHLPNLHPQVHAQGQDHFYAAQSGARYY